MVRHAVRVAAAGVLLALLILGGLFGRTAVFGGASGNVRAAPAATSLAVDAADGSLLKAAGGIFRSTDQGQNWQALSIPDELDPGQIREVATTSAAPDRLYAAGPGAGILRSDDRGKTWRSLDEGLPSKAVGAFAVHSFRPDTLYAWIAEQGVFLTEDGGGAWTLMDEGPPGPVASLAHSTLEGSMKTGWLYAATPDGPYLSMDCF